MKIDSKTSAWSKSEIDRAVEIEAQMANQVRCIQRYGSPCRANA